MELIEFGKEYNDSAVVCLGFFDCMHTGHVKLLKRAQLLAGRMAKVVIFTFRNSHFETLGKPTKLLFTFDERLEIYESLGVDAVIFSNFDEAFRAMDGEEFLRRLCGYKLKGVVCGQDFTCGGDLLSAEGVRKYLVNICPTEIVETVQFDGEKLGSTLIRQLLLDGKVEEANAFLSQPFFFEGTVSEGRRVGRQLGFPTANLRISRQKLAPSGVFCGVAFVDGARYKAVINVGTAPTFEVENICVEAHLLHFDGNLYGKKLKVTLEKYLRPIRKFESGRQLSEQLAADCEVADDQIRT